MIRHAETVANAAGQLTGQIDSALSSTGRIQASAVARRLASEQIDYIYASDLQRAADTAQAVCSQQSTASMPVLREWLRERHAGVLQGLTKQERKSRYPQLHAAWKSTDPDRAIDAGESRRQFQSRVIAGIESLADQHAEDTIAVIAHAGVLLAMFNFVFKCQHNGNHLRCGNASICRFRRQRGLWSMECWGDNAHLREASVTMDALPRDRSCPP